MWRCNRRPCRTRPSSIRGRLDRFRMRLEPSARRTRSTRESCQSERTSRARTSLPGKASATSRARALWPRARSIFVWRWKHGRCLIAGVGNRDSKGVLTAAAGRSCYLEGEVDRGPLHPAVLRPRRSRRACARCGELSPDRCRCRRNRPRSGAAERARTSCRPWAGSKPTPSSLK